MPVNDLFSFCVLFSFTFLIFKINSKVVYKNNIFITFQIIILITKQQFSGDQFFSQSNQVRPNDQITIIQPTLLSHNNIEQLWLINNTLKCRVTYSCDICVNECLNKL